MTPAEEVEPVQEGRGGEVGDLAVSQPASFHL